MTKQDDEDKDRDEREDEESGSEEENDESRDSSDDAEDEAEPVAAKETAHVEGDDKAASTHAADDHAHGDADEGPEPPLEKDSPRMSVITVAYVMTIFFVILCVVFAQQFFNHFMTAEHKVKVQQPASERLLELHSAEAAKLKPESVKKAQDTVLAKYKSPAQPKEAPKPEPTPEPTAAPTVEPTAVPTTSASAAPTTAPTVTATASTKAPTAPAPTAPAPGPKPTQPPTPPAPTPDPY